MIRIALALALSTLLTWTGPAHAAERAAPAVATPGAAFTDCAHCPDMVVVPSGSAEIGSTIEERSRAGVPAVFGDREGPRHRVTFARPFALAKTETTRAEYGVFVAETQRPDPASCAAADTTTYAWSQRAGLSWRAPGYPQTDAHPVVCVSHDDALAYAGWLARTTGLPYRLPSEAEWEYAARAGTVTAWYWGDAPEAGCERANIISSGTIAAIGSPPYWKDRLACQDTRAHSLPVASFAGNPFGLYDMIGNAFEWVADCASANHEGGPTDGTARQSADCRRRFLKGGGFHTPIWLTRAAVRGLPLPSDLHMNTIGFRVARDLTD